MGAETFETHKCALCGIYADGVRGNGLYRNLVMVQHHDDDPTPRTDGQPMWEGRGPLQRPVVPGALILVLVLLVLILI